MILRKQRGNGDARGIDRFSIHVQCAGIAFECHGKMHPSPRLQWSCGEAAGRFGAARRGDQELHVAFVRLGGEEEGLAWVAAKVEDPLPVFSAFPIYPRRDGNVLMICSAGWQRDKAAFTIKFDRSSKTVAWHIFEIAPGDAVVASTLSRRFPSKRYSATSDWLTAHSLLSSPCASAQWRRSRSNSAGRLLLADRQTSYPAARRGQSWRKDRRALWTASHHTPRRMPSPTRTA